jgi:hypothetical protein
MLKTISAALLAVSVLAAPVLAATPASTVKNPVTAPVIKTEQAKPSVLNANAKMGHHVKHRYHRHHRFHKKMGALKTHAKVAIKHINHTAKRG